MKSLFWKNLVIYSLVIVISFSVLGGAFLIQTSRFSLKEKENSVERTTDRAVESTQTYLQMKQMVQSILPGLSGQYEQSYRINMEQLASDIGAIIFVSDTGGELLYVSTNHGCYPQVGGAVPQNASGSVSQTGSYSGTDTFGGYFSTMHYVLGKAVKTKDGSNIAMIFVCIPSNTTVELFKNLRTTFAIMVLVVLLMTLVVTLMVVRTTVRPLKQIADTAKSFAGGDFSVRVPLPKHQDELYEMTRSFNQMADSLENMEENRRELIASVSHDLRTPMTTIGGFVDGILDGTIKPDKQAYYLNIISEEIKRLSRLANSMLQASRYQAADVVIQKATFDISEMLRRIIISFQQKLDDKKIDLQLDIPDSIDVSADRDGMFQVVYNLVDNAVKYVDQGGKITIYLSNRSSTVQFNIINTGGEIEPEQLKHIFERFYKGDRSRQTSKSGAGLGLYIVKTIINRHGGDVVAQSGDGKTEFCFTVPIGS